MEFLKKSLRFIPLALVPTLASAGEIAKLPDQVTF